MVHARGRSDATHITLVWAEQDGPPVSEPTRKGFGSRMIENAFARNMDPRVVLAFPPTGAICTIDVRLVKAAETWRRPARTARTPPDRNFPGRLRFRPSTLTAD